jgi:hypothetical protein
MDSYDLTPEQLDRINKRLRPTLGYLTRLAKRMHAERFPEVDQLRLLTIEARNALRSLTMSVHYLSCRDSTGQPRPPAAKDDPRK